MTTWSYRAVQAADGTVSMREVYYDQSGAIIGHCAPEVIDSYEDVDDLKARLREMLVDADKPLLHEADLPADPPPADATRQEHV